ncbi:hypothetical protein I12448_12770 [Campylobacter jejuni]|nr:hypothetical protein I12448_12770 [Campylobacter jejuni]
MPTTANNDANNIKNMPNGGLKNSTITLIQRPIKPKILKINTIILLYSIFYTVV